MAACVVLDSEALSALAFAASDAKAKRRARVVLELAHETGLTPILPAAVITEVCRGSARDAAVNRVLIGLRLVPIGEKIARIAGALLHAHSLSSAHAVDAMVVATSIVYGGGLIVSGDPKDMRRLAVGYSGIEIIPL